MNESNPRREWTDEELKFRRHWAIVLSWFVVMVGIGICFGAPAKKWFLEDRAQLGLFPQQVDRDPCVQIGKFFESLIHPNQGQSTGSEVEMPIGSNVSSAIPSDTQSSNTSPLMNAVEAPYAAEVKQTYHDPPSCFGRDMISLFLLNLCALAWSFCQVFWDIEVMPSWNSYFSDQMNCNLIFYILSIIYAAVLGWCVQTALKLLHAPYVE